MIKTNDLYNPSAFSLTSLKCNQLNLSIKIHIMVKYRGELFVKRIRISYGIKAITEAEKLTFLCTDSTNYASFEINDSILIFCTKNAWLLFQ